MRRSRRLSRRGQQPVNRASGPLVQFFQIRAGIHDQLVRVGLPSRREVFDVGAVAELVGIEGGVVSGVINLESSGVEASDWRPRHDEQYHEA
jgi:hypothetical protein